MENKAQRHLQKTIDAEIFRFQSNRLLLAKKVGGSNGKNGNKFYKSAYLFMQKTKDGKLLYEVFTVHHEHKKNEIKAKGFMNDRAAAHAYFRSLTGYSTYTVYNNRKRYISNDGITHKGNGWYTQHITTV